MGELAEILNTYKSNVSSWENMKYVPSVPIAFKICKLFNITLDQIYGTENKVIKQYETLP